MKTENLPLVVSIIVHYESPKECATIVEDLEGINYSNHRIVVVDNCSKDSVFFHLTNLLSKTKAILIQNLSNGGYGSGINFGAKYAMYLKPDYFHIINSDTRILNKDYFNEIIIFFKSDKKIAAIGPAVLKADGSVQNTIMPFVSLKSIYFFKQLSKNISKIEINPKIYPVSVINGVCIFIAFGAFSEIKGFDDSFFMYGEEQDLCYRLHKSGYSVYFWSGSSIQHFEFHSRTVSKMLTWRDLLIRANQVLYFQKHINLLGALVLSILFSISFLLKKIKGYTFNSFSFLDTIKFLFLPSKLNSFFKNR